MTRQATLLGTQPPAVIVPRLTSLADLHLRASRRPKIQTTHGAIGVDRGVRIGNHLHPPPAALPDGMQAAGGTAAGTHGEVLHSSPPAGIANSGARHWLGKAFA